MLCSGKNPLLGDQMALSIFLHQTKFDFLLLLSRFSDISWWSIVNLWKGSSLRHLARGKELGFAMLLEVGPSFLGSVSCIWTRQALLLTKRGSANTRRQEVHSVFLLTQVVAVSFPHRLGSDLTISFDWLVCKESAYRKWWKRKEVPAPRKGCRKGSVLRATKFLK